MGCPASHSSPSAKDAGTPLEQHNVEIHENRASWNAKPLLREVYAHFYRMIRDRLPAGRKGAVVEIGSGMGNIKEWIPDCVTTDLFPNPWLDRVESVYRLSCADSSASAFVLFDVFHHLRHPGAALADMRRALEKGGRVILIEPDMGALGRFIFGKFHHEPLGLGEKIEWDAPAGWNPDDHGYYAAQGNASRIFTDGELHEKLAGWRVVEVKRMPAFSYIGSGGFRGPQVYPRSLLPLVRAVENIFALLPGLFSTRLIVVLERHD